MKIMIIVVTLIWSITSASAQLTGKIRTGDDQPVPFASVLLLSAADSSMAGGAVTSENGDFSIEKMKSGSYLLSFSSLGFQSWVSPVFQFESGEVKKDFGVIIVKETNQQLAEVNVKGTKSLVEHSPEGLVLNVQNSVMTRGSSLLDVLERSPGVAVDRRNNGISLNGKDGVLVMFDGKLMRLPPAQIVSLLNGMSANDIEKVELLSSPSARYDAEGNGGIINIITKKKSTYGSSGSVSLTGGYGYREKALASLNFSKTTEKLTANIAYNFSHDRSYSFMHINSSQNMPVMGGRLDVVVNDTAHYAANSHYLNVGLEHKLNKKWTVGANASLASNYSTTTNHSHSVYTILPDSLLFFNGNIQSENHWQNLISSVFLDKQFRENGKVNFNFDYLRFSNNNPSYISSIFTDDQGSEAGNNDSLFAQNQRGLAKTTIHVGVFKTDYSRALGKKIKMEAGLKLTYSTGHSLSGIKSLMDGHWIARSETTNRITMRESIGAGYLQFVFTPNPSTNIAAGLRYENASTDMRDPENPDNSIHRKITKFFPSLSVSKRINDDQEIGIAFFKRINRPTYNDLASYVSYSDPTAVYSGNPLLKPAISSNLKLSYAYRGYAFALILSNDVNPIARYQITQKPAGNLLYVSPQNLVYQKMMNLQVNIPLSVNRWWSMNYNFTGGIRAFKVDHTLVPVQKEYAAYSTSLSQTLKLPGAFTLEISGWLNSAAYNGSIKTGMVGTLNAGLKKELKMNRGTFQLSATDLLRTLQYNSYYGTLTKEAFSITNHVAFNTESRYSPIFKLSFFKSFGGKVITRQSGGSAGDEVDRLKNN